MNGAMLPNDASIIFSAAYTYCHYKTVEYQKKNRYSQTYLYTTAQVLSVICQKNQFQQTQHFLAQMAFQTAIMYYRLMILPQALVTFYPFFLLLLHLAILVFRHPVIYLSVALSTVFFISFLSCYLSGNPSSYKFVTFKSGYLPGFLSGFYFFSVFLDGYR